MHLLCPFLVFVVVVLFLYFENYFVSDDILGREESCRLANADLGRHFLKNRIYNITCSHGYDLNYNAEWYECREGHLLPVNDVYTVDTSNTEPAKCLPGKYTNVQKIMQNLSK